MSIYKLRIVLSRQTNNEFTCDIYNKSSRLCLRTTITSILPHPHPHPPRKPFDGTSLFYHKTTWHGVLSRLIYVSRSEPSMRRHFSWNPSSLEVLISLFPPPDSTHLMCPFSCFRKTQVVPGSMPSSLFLESNTSWN